ncbi:MAG: hypothetical protein UV46_C0016G0004 [Candidatus Gottesmanbacteria bacterium GW2011_GWC2_42_8]|nr:MAG: hypothetical protein UV46_C0016G0004 [Candidatus Gottesmanbacteria bacterium GW2011_GWC2_42_8]
MKILLSYSKYHFDPSKSPQVQKYWYTSAGILARSLYRILSEIGDVTYIGGNEIDSIRGGEFDLFVGTHYKFRKILKLCQIKKSILFAVNMHPLERNRLLLSFLLRERLNLQALAGWDLMNFMSIRQSLSSADYIICAGNMKTFNSYIKRGIPKKKIKMINYGVEYHSEIIKKKVGVPEFVYSTSEIGLRKGFDILYSLFTNPRITSQEFHLKIMGLPTNAFYEKKLKKFLKILGNKAEYFGWVDAGSLKYRRIVAKSDFFILPSLEEGQAGTAVEAIGSGIIPLLSENCGIDFAPLGTLELKTDSEVNRKIFLKALSMPKDEVTRWKIKTKEYYKLFHADFINFLAEAVQGAVKNELYPKISVVLPIFNKEKTIKPLIELLDQALREYGNSELHIFFDGCRDKTEAIVRDFYKEKKDYRVTFSVTPNIFETKTNNLGLKKSTGKYAVVLQDDNFIFDKNIFFEAVSVMEKSPKTAILGALAGVNFYPRGTKGLSGKGQIVVNEHEVYWRQDENTNPELKHRIFETDACMRGPLIIRNSFLEKFGILDEAYAPYYMDDMDLCFRAKSKGYKVFAFLSDTVNTSGSISVYQGNNWKIWEKVVKENPDRFYSRWQPTKIKDFLELERIPLYENLMEKITRITGLFLMKNGKKFGNRILIYIYYLGRQLINFISLNYISRFKKNYKNVSYSQCGEDRIILHLLETIGLDKPFYVDIGAYHPFHISNTALLYELGSRGVNVEPNPDVRGLFHKYRSQDINISAGISDSEGVMIYYCFNVSTLNTFSQKEARRNLREGYKLIGKKKIPVTTLKKIIRIYCLGRVPDILFIDIEGSEVKLLNSLKNMKIKPAILCVETAGFSAKGIARKNINLINSITRLGYKLYADTHLNSIFINRSFRK